MGNYYIILYAQCVDFWENLTWHKEHTVFMGFPRVCHLVIVHRGSAGFPSGDRRLVRYRGWRPERVLCRGLGRGRGLDRRLGRARRPRGDTGHSRGRDVLRLRCHGGVAGTVQSRQQALLITTSPERHRTTPSPVRWSDPCRQQQP